MEIFSLVKQTSLKYLNTCAEIIQGIQELRWEVPKLFFSQQEKVWLIVSI